MKRYIVPKSEFDRIRQLNCSADIRASLFADLARINTLYMIKKAGSGHIGSSFSSLDIVSWIYLNELGEPQSDANNLEHIYYSSKGHDAPALYACMLGLGLLPFEKIHQLRRLDGLPGHPDVGTAFIKTNTGSLGMGISKAKGMAFANRLAGKKCNLFVLTGDGELQEGQFWESLASAAHAGLHELTVIVDHNKIQSDTWVKNVNDLGDLKAKITSFGWHVVRCDGHDLKVFSSTLEQANLINKPTVIIADTIKGSGVSFMQSTAMVAEQEFYHYHSGAPTEEEYQRATEELIENTCHKLEALQQDILQVDEVTVAATTAATAKVEKLIPAYSETLFELGAEYKKLVVLDADLILDCGLIQFRDAYAERFIECGIAEQDMVSQAGGMALQGLLPIVHSFACFLTPRANEQIYNNATEKTKVIYVGSLAGVLPAGPGHSHQSVRDIGILSSIPGLTLIEPSCAQEVKLALEYAVKYCQHSVYIRLVSIPCEIDFKLPTDYVLQTGHGITLREGSDAVIFSYGPIMLTQAMRAALLLQEKHGLNFKVVNQPWLNEIDLDNLKSSIGDCKQVYTLDNHYVKDGQGEFIAAKIAALGLPTKVVNFGLSEIPACGQNEEVLQYHGLDAASLADKIKDSYV